MIGRGEMLGKVIGEQIGNRQIDASLFRVGDQLGPAVLRNLAVRPAAIFWVGPTIDARDINAGGFRDDFVIAAELLKDTCCRSAHRAMMR